MRTVKVCGIARLGLAGGALLAVAGCDSAAQSPEAIESRASAVMLSASNLDLQVLGNSLWANGAQEYFKVKNNDAAAIKLSDVSIKFWVNDTTGSVVVPHINYGGCVTNAAGTCVHPVTNVTATAAPFTACGPEAQHQANWEITVSTTDASTISPGFTWSNLQTSLNLASYANFSPGAATWYSPGGTGQAFHTDAHYSVYVKGFLVTTLGITPPDCRAPHGSQPITTYTSPPASPPAGSLAKDKVLTVALSLPLRNFAALQAKVDAAADPASPTYRQWLTPAQLLADHTPIDTDFNALKAWASSKGLQVSSQPTHIVAGLIGTVAQIEKAFFVNMITGHRADGTIFYAPDRQPSIDLGTTVLSVSGIDDFIPTRTAASGGRAPLVPPSIDHGFQSNDFREGYLGQAPASSCLSLTGAGQSVGVFSMDTGINQSDIQAYITNTGLTGVPVPTINVAGTPDGVTPTPLAADDGGNSVETSLDVEMVIAMAPGAQVVVFEGNNVELMLEAMVNQPNVAQLTSSYYKPATATAVQLHTLMAAQGQAFFEASGDFGSYPLASAAQPPPPAPTCYTDPLGAGMTWDMPYITIVGGTELDLIAGAYQREQTWVGSAGGVLPSVPIPSWQLNANPANGKLSATARNVPDVAMPSTNLYIVYPTCDNVGGLPGLYGVIAPARCTANVQCTTIPDGKGGTLTLYTGCKAGKETAGNPGVIGGTSGSTPLWAGFMALVNQRSQAQGQGKVGFPNPTLYAIGRGPQYANSFTDIKDGSPSNKACDGTQYTAVLGYDQTTGWGSPRCGLISQLAPSPSSPNPPTLPNPPILTVAGNNNQTSSAAVTLCGQGLNFTPGASVTLTITNIPDFNGVPHAPVQFGPFTVGADGKFSYKISPTSLPPPVACSTAQLFDDVTVTATDAQQELAPDTFNASNFCNNTSSLPGSFGGGCP